MSPVSRGRKPKKSSSTKRSRTRARSRPEGVAPAVARPDLPAATIAAMQRRLLGPPERPTWFDASIESILDDAERLRRARGPRELDQLTAELLGEQMHRAVREETRGLWFEWWFTELADAAAHRVRLDGDSCEAPLWLLHGLAAHVHPSAGMAERVAAARALLPAAAAARLPEWLAAVPRSAATGEVFRMRDAYGTRFAVIAGFAYADDPDRSVFLFDIDASGFVVLAGAGVFDDVEQAAGAWRAAVGESAENTRPEAVENGNELQCLVHLETGDEHAIHGDEPRPVWDNWFRFRRRLCDLSDALDVRGMSLPKAASLYHDLDATVMIAEFAAWHEQTTGVPPDSEGLEALAYEWVEGALPETWYAVSPRRVEFQLGLIGDWMPNHPVTGTALELLPHWVRWLGERAGLPEHLRRRTETAVTIGS